MANDDPFSGLHLSEQTPSNQIEQRLFAPEPSPASLSKRPQPRSEKERQKPIPQIKPPTGSENTVQGTAEQAPSATSSPEKKSGPPPPQFDLDDEPLYQASFVFTQDELEALEDLKLELRREYDTKVTKNALIRSALHMLLEDHRANGTRSYATRKILRQ